MKERQDNEHGLDWCIIEHILKVKCGKYPQAFHGGEMNGVCCKYLLQHISEIMTVIKDIASKRLQHQIDANVNRIEAHSWNSPIASNNSKTYSGPLTIHFHCSGYLDLLKKK